MLSSTKHLASACALALLPIMPMSLLAPSPAVAQVSIGISVNIAPPILPVYVQPALPAPGYIWTPGYWAWDPVVADYFWVPGAWVTPPRVGLLWTPGYWGWGNGVYFFHSGYWGPRIGFYGGVNYGFGYTGVGFYGGQWRGGQFYYNSSVSNVTNVNVTNVYNKTVVVNNNAPRTSFNGGPNGTAVKPTPAELAAAKAPHVAPTAAQVQHVNAAKANPQARFSTNQGKPANPALEKPLTGGAPPEKGGGPAEKTGEGVGNGAPGNGGAGKGVGENPKVGGEPMERPRLEHAPPRPAPPRAAPPRPALRPPPRPAPHAPPCRGPNCR